MERLHGVSACRATFGSVNSIHAPAAGVPLSWTYWPPLAPASEVTWLPVADAVRVNPSASYVTLVPVAPPVPLPPVAVAEPDR